MNRFRFLVCLAIAAGFGSTAHARFAQEGSDLVPDPQVRFGTLANGIRYAIRSNPEPKGRASLRFAVTAGSLEETDDQCGIAHFLEHLAFNGSTHFPPGTLVEYFQRLGMGFGGDTNAFTTHDRTEYQLELPNTKFETFEKAFTLFSDYGGGLLLESHSIEKERGIILAEKRARDSVGYRESMDETAFLLPNSRIVNRAPIGSESVVSNAARDRFTDFYKTWYRPENFIVSVVGDFDVAQVEAQLKAALAPLESRGPSRPKPMLDSVAAFTGVHVRLHTERDAPETHVSIETAVTFRDLPDLRANRLRALPRDLAVAMLNRRLSLRAKKEGSPFTDGQASVSEQLHAVRIAAIGLSCAPSKWKDALGAAETELRAALQFGFQEEELREVIANLTNDLQEAVRTASTRSSRQLADQLVNSIVDDKVFLAPASLQELYRPTLEQMTPEACNAAFREAWSEASGRSIYVSGNLSLANPDDEVLAAYHASQALPVAPPVDESISNFGYADFGAAGAVTERKVLADLGVTLVTFANGVRLNLKPTDFEAGQIVVSVRVGGGKLAMPAGQPGLGFVAENLFLAGGLGKHSTDELQRIMAGKTVQTAFKVAPDACQFVGATNRADLVSQFEILCAYLTDPGFRVEAQRQFDQRKPAFFAKLTHTVEGPMQAEVPRLLSCGDPRFGIPTEAELGERNAAEAKMWLTNQFARGPIEIGLVGDFVPDEAIAAVAKTFGTLPHRDPKPDYAAERKVNFPVPPLTKEFEVPTEIPHAIVMVFWPATDSRDVHLARRLTLLASVLTDRLRLQLREKMGSTYSPVAAAVLSDTCTGYGFLVAQSEASPGAAESVRVAIDAVATELATHGISDDELVRAKAPLLTEVRESLRSNAHWLGSFVAVAQEFPERLASSKDRLTDLEGVTAPELSILAAKYLKNEGASHFISRPRALDPAASR